MIRCYGGAVRRGGGGGGCTRLIVDRPHLRGGLLALASHRRRHVRRSRRARGFVHPATMRRFISTGTVSGDNELPSVKKKPTQHCDGNDDYTTTTVTTMTHVRLLARNCSASLVVSCVSRSLLFPSFQLRSLLATLLRLFLPRLTPIWHSFYAFAAHRARYFVSRPSGMDTPVLFARRPFAAATAAAAASTARSALTKEGMQSRESGREKRARGELENNKRGYYKRGERRGKNGCKERREPKEEQKKRKRRIAHLSLAAHEEVEEHDRYAIRLFANRSRSAERTASYLRLFLDGALSVLTHHVHCENSFFSFTQHYLYVLFFCFLFFYLSVLHRVLRRSSSLFSDLTLRIHSPLLPFDSFDQF